MDDATFEKIADKIRELVDNKYIFEDMRLVSYDENSHHAVIELQDVIRVNNVKFKFTHEVIEAFDSILGVETTVSCVFPDPKIREPHERFIM